MSSISVNTITDASGGATTSINGFTPSVSNMAGRNRIINGAQTINQRATTLTDYGYATDRWSYNPAGANQATVAQSSNAPVGFKNSLLVTSSVATFVGATDVYIIEQKIEGYNTIDLGFGTASAKTITISFWVRSSLTGTFGGALGNAGPDRSYPFTYTISSANTWEQKTIVIPGDTTGTWDTSNGTAFRLCFSLGCGSSRSGSAGAWTGTSNIFSVTGASAPISVSGATWQVTGVQLEEGSVATPFEHRQYGQELALCQRYYWQDSICGIDGYGSSGMALALRQRHPVQMRVTPTITQSGATVVNANTPSSTFGIDAGTSNDLATNTTTSVSSSGRAYLYRPVQFSAEL